MLFIFIQVFLLFLLGSIYGNLLTAFFFRIPRNIPLNGIQMPPMCSSCGIKIKYPYYAPFIHLIVKGRRCGACKAKIPIIYTIIEAVSGIACTLFFMYRGISIFTVISFFCTTIISLKALLFFQNQKVYEKLNWMLLVIVLIKAFYISKAPDFITDIIFSHLIYGIICVTIFTIIHRKSAQIEIICLMLIFSIVPSSLVFVILATIATLLFSIASLKRLFLLPFLFYFIVF